MLFSLVPTFDGCEGFDLNRLQKLSRIEDELLEDSAVLVAFTVGSYTNAASISYNGANVVTALSLNAQLIVLIAPPSQGQNVDFTKAQEEAVGVTKELPFVIDTVKPAYTEFSIGSGSEDSVGVML